MFDFIFNFHYIGLIIITYLLYWLGTYQYKLHVKLGCCGPTPLPFIGNMISLFIYGMHETDKQCREKFGKLYPFYFGSSPIIMVSDEELMKQILIRDFKCFTDRLDIGLKSKRSESMLTLLKGKDWERVRNLVSPTFTSGKLKRMSPLLVACVDLLTERLKNSPPNAHFDMKELFGALTMDAIARTMFGMEIDSQTNSKNLFIINAKRISKLSLTRPTIFLMILFPKIAAIVRKFYPDWEPMGESEMHFLCSNIQRAINERKVSTEIYNDFLALMLKSGSNKTGEDINTIRVDDRHLSAQEIEAQSLIFLIAGYETTATTLTFISYYLAMNPSIQEEVYHELTDIMEAEGELSYEALSRMSLLDGTINETLRLCPPVVRFDRVCTQDIDLVTSDGKTIHASKGDVFAVPVYAIQTDPSIWPNPEIFDIHRFDRDQKKDRSLYAHMPFGMGPRNCVGMRFALLEMKWAIASILKDFEFVPCSETPKRIKFKNFGFSQPDKTIIVKVQRRQ